MKRATTSTHIGFILTTLIVGSLLGWATLEISNSFVLFILVDGAILSILWELFYGPQVTWDYLDD